MIITCPSCSTRYPVDEASFMPSGRKVRCAKCGNSWHQNPIVEPPPEPFRIDPSKPPMFAKPASKPAPKPQVVEAEAEPAPVVVDEADAAPVAGEPVAAEAVEAAPAPVEDPNARRPRVVPTVVVPPPAGTGGRLRAFVNEAATSRRDRVLAILAWSLMGIFVLGTIVAAVNYRKEIVALWPATAKVYAAAGAPVNLQGIEFRNVSYERQSENNLPVLAVMGEVHNVSGATRTLPRLRVGLFDKDQHELYHWTFALPEHEIAANQTMPFVTRLSSPPAEARDIEVRFVQPSENEASLPPPEAAEATAPAADAAPADAAEATTDAMPDAAAPSDVAAPIDAEAAEASAETGDSSAGVTAEEPLVEGGH